MDKLATHKITKDIVSRYGFRFTKSLGQNFLVDEHVLSQIVESANIKEDDVVLEIGPGIGTLTREISYRAKQVICIEIDKKLIPILKETLSDRDNITVINQDILKTDLNAIIEEYSPEKKIKVVANLPYYITTPIIMRFLEEVLPFETMVFMIQKEVANRMNALPGGKEYGSLSVAVQYYCNTSIVTKVPKGAFIPEPGVDSAVIRLDLKEDKGIDLIDEDLFFEVVKAAFSKRRKTLLNALSSFGSIGGKEEAKSALQMADIDPSRRGETLDIKEFAALSNAYAGMLSR